MKPVTTYTLQAKRISSPKHWACRTSGFPARAGTTLVEASVFPARSKADSSSSGLRAYTEDRLSRQRGRLLLVLPFQVSGPWLWTKERVEPLHLQARSRQGGESEGLAAASPPLLVGLRSGAGTQGPGIRPAISGCSGESHRAFLLNGLTKCHSGSYQEWAGVLESGCCAQVNPQSCCLVLKASHTPVF